MGQYEKKRWRYYLNDPKHRSSRWRALLQSSRQKVSTLLTSAKDRLAHLLHLPDKRSAQPTKEQKKSLHPRVEPITTLF